jgi:hypothetical protein
MLPQNFDHPQKVPPLNDLYEMDSFTWLAGCRKAFSSMVKHAPVQSPSSPVLSELLSSDWCSSEWLRTMAKAAARLLLQLDDSGMVTLNFGNACSHVTRTRTMPIFKHSSLLKLNLLKVWDSQFSLLQLIGCVSKGTIQNSQV